MGYLTHSVDVILRFVNFLRDYMEVMRPRERIRFITVKGERIYFHHLENRRKHVLLFKSINKPKWVFRGNVYFCCKHTNNLLL